MTHPADDALLLFAYEELGEGGEAIEAHLAECAECRARLARIDEARAAIDWGLENKPARRPRRLVWLALPLAAAAGVAVLIARRPPKAPAEPGSWQTRLVASSTAGYVAGGAAFIAIDSQLTRLEQGIHHDAH